jgi:hypothetical protein
MLKLRTFVVLSMVALLAGSTLAAPAARPAATKSTTTTASVPRGGRTIVSWACALVPYRTACELGLGNRPGAGTVFQLDGIDDSPDSIDPLVNKRSLPPPATTQNSWVPNP